MPKLAEAGWLGAGGAEGEGDNGGVGVKDAGGDVLGGDCDRAGAVAARVVRATRHSEWAGRVIILSKLETDITFALKNPLRWIRC